MTEGSRQESRSYRGLIVGLVISIVLSVLLGTVLGYVAVEQQLQQIDYRAQITSISPDKGCVAMLHNMGGAVVRDLAKVVSELPFPVNVDPRELNPDAGSGERDASAGAAADVGESQGEAGAGAARGSGDAGDAPVEEEEGGEEEEDCNAKITMKIYVSNPLPLSMSAKIKEVKVTVAAQPLSASQIDISGMNLEAEGGGQLSKEVTFHLNIQQIMAAASGILLRKKLAIKAKALVEVSVLGGVVGQEMWLPVTREVTVRELLEGVAGTLTAE